MTGHWVGGDRTHLIDSSGERYLDLISGYGVFALGRNQPDVTQAVREVLDAGMGNLPQLGVTLLSGVLAEQLLARCTRQRCRDGAGEHGDRGGGGGDQDRAGRHGTSAVVVCRSRVSRSHARLVSVNGNDEFRAGFGPAMPDCEPVRFGDLDALEQELGQGDVAGLIIEPIQGKGVHIPPDGYLQGAQRLCHAAGALLICDEVQTGVGRTGRFLALEHWDLEPDMICMAKALSGGIVPIGAVLVSRASFDRVFDGMERAVRHGSTFGGNDLAAAAALATLRVIDRDGVVAHAERMGALLLEQTRPLIDASRDRPRRARVRADVGDRAGPTSRGSRRALFNAVERAQPGLFAQLITVPLFREHRILCQVAGHRMNVVKALPSLLIDEEEVRRFAAALTEVVAAAERTPGAHRAVRSGDGTRRGASPSAPRTRDGGVPDRRPEPADRPDRFIEEWPRSPLDARARHGSSGLRRRPCRAGAR